MIFALCLAQRIRPAQRPRGSARGAPPEASGVRNTNRQHGTVSLSFRFHETVSRIHNTSRHYEMSQWPECDASAEVLGIPCAERVAVVYRRGTEEPKHNKGAIMPREGGGVQSVLQSGVM